MTQTLKSQESFNWAGMLITFSLVRSKKRKHSYALKVKSDGTLQVNVPFKTKRADIEDFITAKYQWIAAIQQQKQHNPSLKLGYQQGEKHYFRGKKLPLQLIQCHFSSVRISEELITVFHRKSSSIKNILLKAYKQKSLEYFTLRTQELAQRFSFPTVKQIKVRVMKARWGSCSHDRVITYNTHLIKAADELIDYVILHELCHLLHHNHGRGFYQLQSKLNPQWKRQKQELHEQGHHWII